MGGTDVRGVTDGDTLTVADGRTVRLAQVDAPETRDCFGSQSTAALRALVEDSSVVLRRPVDGPERDKYGRTLADVSVGGVSVNEALVRQGAAEWYEEFAGEGAEPAHQLRAAEQEARAAGRGLWGACSTPPATPTPASASASASASPVGLSAPATTVAPSVGGDCDPAYPDLCLPSSTPDLDCGDIPHRRFRVLPPDPHRFDGNDNDGIGCESS